MSRSIPAPSDVAAPASDANNGQRAGNQEFSNSAPALNILARTRG